MPHEFADRARLRSVLRQELIKQHDIGRDVLDLAALGIIGTLGRVTGARPSQNRGGRGDLQYELRRLPHGDQLVNTGQTFDLRQLRADERPRFENSVRNGRNQMPPWKGVLSDEDIDQLWFYIRANAYPN